MSGFPRIIICTFDERGPLYLYDDGMDPAEAAAQITKALPMIYIDRTDGPPLSIDQDGNIIPN